MRIQLFAIILSSFALMAWSPWDWEEADLTVECAAVYGTASYAVRTYKYKPPKGQDKQAAADHFQRLSNILRYFATNSGYEEDMKKKLDAAFAQKKILVDEKKSVDVLFENIENCDTHLDRLYELYTK